MARSRCWRPLQLFQYVIYFFQINQWASFLIFGLCVWCSVLVLVLIWTAEFLNVVSSFALKLDEDIVAGANSVGSRAGSQGSARSTVTSAGRPQLLAQRDGPHGDDDSDADSAVSFELPVMRALGPQEVFAPPIEAFFRREERVSLSNDSGVYNNWYLKMMLLLSYYVIKFV